MRKTATLRSPVNGIQRAMIYQSERGVYLFLFESDSDGPSDYDYWYESLADAEEDAAESYGVSPAEWTVIDDPIPGALDDWIRPTRVKRDSEGNPLYGEFEAIISEE